MNNYILKFCFLFLNFIATAQTDDILEFQPIRVFDTITAKKTISEIKELDKINDHLFFTTGYLENEGLFLIEKNNTYWIVYDYNDFVSNFVVEKHSKLNNKYVSIEVKAARSGYGTNEYSWYLIFDLENKSYITLNKSSYNADEKNTVLSSCESSIKFTKNIVTVEKTCYPKDECLNCIEGGTYSIQNGKLVKSKSSHYR